MRVEEVGAREEDYGKGESEENYKKKLIRSVGEEIRRDRGPFETVKIRENSLREMRGLKSKHGLK